jgi:hypothetical protein
MQYWREELKAALPGHTWREILKRLRYLGIILHKRRIVKSEGDDLGRRLWVYISRYDNLSDGGEGEGDEVEAIAHMEAYQRAAEGARSPASCLCRSELGGPSEVEAPPPVADPIDEADFRESTPASISRSSGEAEGSIPPSKSEEAPSDLERRPMGGFAFARMAPWRSDEDAAIREGVEAGKSWKAIAKGLPGRSVFATAVRGRRLGLRPRERWTADEDATLRAGVEAGEPWETIVERLPGRTGQMAQLRARWLGIEPRGKQTHRAWTEAEDAEIRAGVEAGESWQAIAERLSGRNDEMVKGRARRLHIERSEKKSISEERREGKECIRECGSLGAA